MHKTSWRIHLLTSLLVSLGLFTIAACGTSNVGTISGSVNASTTASPTSGTLGGTISKLPANACSLVSAAQMQQITNMAYKPFSSAVIAPPAGATDAAFCQTSTSDLNAVADYAIDVFPATAGASTYYTREKALITQKEGAISVVNGVGDQAFSGAHDPLFVLKSNVVMQVLIGTTTAFANQNAEAQVATLIIAGL